MSIDLRPPASRRGSPPAAENGRVAPGAQASGLAARFRRQPVLNSMLLALCIAAVALAVSAIGPSTQSSGASTRTSTAKQGVVQSTVSGSGNIQSSSQLDLGFKTSGTVSHIYVKEGQHLVKGQLLATLDSKSTEASLQQAEATLKSAEANLAQLEENEGESTGSGGGGSTSSVSYTTYSATSTTSPSTTSAPAQTRTSATGTTPTTSTGTTTTSSPPTQNTSKQAAGSSEGTGASSSSQSSATKQSAATREANLASARATVKGDQVSVESAERAVQNTKLYAPQDGTIVSLSGEVGETVSATGTSRASSSTSSSSTSASGSGASGASAAGASGSSQASQSSASGSSSFAVLSDLESMQLVVGLSESEIGRVHTGQIATVTIEALSGRKLAAHVAKVAQLATSSSGAASYDVTFQLDQQTPGLKVGMSATAEVVVAQAEGVNVATSAIKGGTVTVIRAGKQVTQPVTTGLAGDSTTIVLSGLKAGEKVLLPSVASTGSSSSSTSSSRFGRSSRSGLGGFAGGGFAGGGLPSGGPPG